MPAGVPNKHYSLQKLWGKHEEILRLYAAGAKPEAIARELGITSQTVYNLVNSSLGAAKIAQLQGKRDVDFLAVQERIAALQPVALEVLEDVMLNALNSPRLRADTARSLLSAGGHGPVSKSVSATTQKLTDKDRLHIDQIADKFRASSLAIDDVAFNEKDSSDDTTK